MRGLPCDGRSRANSDCFCSENRVIEVFFAWEIWYKDTSSAMRVASGLAMRDVGELSPLHPSGSSLCLSVYLCPVLFCLSCPVLSCPFSAYSSVLSCAYPVLSVLSCAYPVLSVLVSVCMQNEAMGGACFKAKEVAAKAAAAKAAAAAGLKEGDTAEAADTAATSAAEGAAAEAPAAEELSSNLAFAKKVPGT